MPVMAPAKLIFLAGAPVAGVLDWSDRALTAPFAVSTKRYLGIEHGLSGTPSTQLRSNWRAVSLRDKLFYQSQAPENQPTRRESGTQFLNTDSLDQDYAFLAHSLAVHKNTQFTQLARDVEDEDESTFVTEFESTVLDDTTNLLAGKSLLDSTLLPTPPVNQAYHAFKGQLTNVRAIPNADYLNKLQPQTMTVNLIAGIISMSPPRTVKVRRGNYDMDILEVILGDETQAGFTFSSWHIPLDSQKADFDPLRQTLMSLRPQDIVLVEQVALTSFKGLVFGQSLNRKVSKSATKITVVCKADRLGGGSNEYDQQAMLSPHVAAKLQRVKDWVTSFVAGPAKKRRLARHEHDRRRCSPVHESRDAGRDEEEHLPPDSSSD